MTEHTLDNFIGKNVMIHIWNHQVDAGTLIKDKGYYGCQKEKNDAVGLYEAHMIVAIKEIERK